MKSVAALEIMSPHDLAALLRRLENREVEGNDYPILVKLIRLLQTVQSELETNRATIATLRRLLFGPRSEKQKVEALPEEANQVSIPAPETALAVPIPDQTDPETEPTAASKVVPLDRKRRKGHGRLGAAAYTGAKVVTCDHHLKPQNPCPDPLCPGHLYDTKAPQLFLRLEGRPAIDATRFELQTLRCSACQERFPAPLPKEVKPEKYDPSADVVMALLKYGASVPFYRLERLQGMMGIPLPASNQYARCRLLAETIQPLFAELKQQAAQSEIWHGDDTWLRLLGCLSEAQTPEDSKRTGRFTTGILARTGDRQIALYLSGGLHAGENLAALAARRPAGLPVPIVMADPEAKNWSRAFKRLVAKCLVHGRRQFVEISARFPAACQRVLDDLAAVYRFEAHTTGMDPDARLAYHQRHSQPVLEKLKDWMTDQVENREVEPNSGLGQAMAYFLRHYEGLTLFLRVGNAPLDNNLAEQVLRRAVLHRKNSLFYRSSRGAETGDVLTSLIETCIRNRVNAYDYLVALLTHSREMRACPSAWLPWNYLEQLTSQAA